MNLKTLTVTCLAAMTATAATAGNIIGTVKDKATGEPLIGTVVSVKDIKDMWATTGAACAAALPQRGDICLWPHP